MDTTSYKRYYLLSIILIALGVSLSTILGEELGAIGTVMIALGGLFFIISMALKKQGSH